MINEIKTMHYGFEPQKLEYCISLCYLFLPMPDTICCSDWVDWHNFFHRGLGFDCVDSHCLGFKSSDWIFLLLQVRFGLTQLKKYIYMKNIFSG